MTQTISNLPEGEYTVSALLRGGTNVTLTLSAQCGAETLTESLTGVGNKTVEGSEYQNGWMRLSLPTIKVKEGDAITISAKGTGSGSAWWSADHFQMKFVSKEALGIESVEREESEAWSPEREAWSVGREEKIFDLQGREISTKPQRGIYIKNKKKHFITY
jgi:hypothetical protein